jgi:hypothetical protein
MQSINIFCGQSSELLDLKAGYSIDIQLPLCFEAFHAQGINIWKSDVFLNTRSLETVDQPPPPRLKIRWTQGPRNLSRDYF